MSDPYAGQITCLINSEGNPGVPGLITDYSPLRSPIRVVGACGSRSEYKKYGNFSALFNPSQESTGYIGLAATGVCDFGTGDYTVESWEKLLSLGFTNYLFTTQSSNASGLMAISVASNGAISHSFFDGSSRPAVTSAAGLIVVGQEFHWRAVRSGGMCYLFVNGVSVGTPLTVSMSVSSADPRIGMNPASSGERRSGYCDDFCITKGIARSTASFTPPAAYDYTPDPATTCKKARGAITKSAYPIPSPLTISQLKRVMENSPQRSTGLGRIVATTKQKASPVNTPYPCRVVLHRHVDDMPVGQTWSDAAGNYAFTNLDPRLKYYAVGFDSAGTYGAVIADNLTPTV